jgi:hypothetical protein
MDNEADEIEIELKNFFDCFWESVPRMRRLQKYAENSEISHIPERTIEQCRRREKLTESNVSEISDIWCTYVANWIYFSSPVSIIIFSM